MKLVFPRPRFIDSLLTKYIALISFLQLLFRLGLPALALFLLANWLVWGEKLAYYGTVNLTVSIMSLSPWMSCIGDGSCKPESVVLMCLIRLYVETFKLYVLLLLGSLSIAIYNIGQTAKLLANEKEKLEIRKVIQFYIK
jgi:hypothetical protein